MGYIVHRLYNLDSLRDLKKCVINRLFYLITESLLEMMA